MKQLSNVRKARKQRGQGMTEYIIIVALVAISAIAVYAWFGKDVRGQMASISSQLAGNSGAAGLAAAQTARNGAKTEGNATYNLGTYNKNVANVGQ